VLSSPTVQVDTPFGIETLRNPLFQYTFLNHPEPQEWFSTHGGGGDAWSGEQPFTIRYPDANNQSQNSVLPGLFANAGGYLATLVVSILLQLRIYD
jgi:hypothetical protein